MKFMNDWIGLALALGFLCGGFVIGRRFGAVTSWWLAGGAWLAFRLADTVWKPAVIAWRTQNPEGELSSGIPFVYGFLFLALLAPTLVWVVILRPGDDVALPGKSQVALGVAGGAVLGAVLLFALVQAHVMHPVVRERMPGTMELAGTVLRGLGQQHPGAGAVEAGPKAR